MRFLIFVLFTVSVSISHAKDDGRTKPNIVFLLVDDMGYGDIASYGAPDVRTPNLDRLAKEGVRFTQFYANGAECSPTRTSIFTGRYPQRVGGMECAIGTGNVGRYDDAIRLAAQHDLGLPAEKAVLAQPLKNQGYATGLFGKWHLGYETKFLPSRFGFDESFYFLGGNVDYFTHQELSPLPVLYKGNTPLERPGYMTHLLTEDATAFIEKHKDGPFFLYVPFSTPHFPFQAPGDAEKVFTAENWMAGSRETYVAMLEDMDTQVGRILKSLHDAGVDKNTLLVFASDHGAMEPGRNEPFRGKKGGLFEGGIRTVCMARWPGHLPAGTVSSQVTLTMDLTASFLRVAGAGDGRPLDGIDILQHIEAGKPDIPRSIGWRARRGDRTWWAYRDGDMKYVRKLEGGVDEEWAFDLATDPGEKFSLIGKRGDVVNKLKAKLSAWEAEVRPER